MRGGAALECVPERIAEQLSRESCSEMGSGTHSAAAHFRRKRAPCEHRGGGISGGGIAGGGIA
eukprot:1873164-Lingulodinium_polyedra.AAC.1